MAAPARLSPAANLLRNSKLFALPSAIPLPPSKPIAEPTAGSDTATTIYPTRAAISTPQASLLRGDWGLKRALPLKSTTDTSTPSVRLTKDIDSAGHVTDFESAADHVQTHAKWQDVHFQIKNTPGWVSRTGAQFDGRQLSVFHPELDNATVRRGIPGPIHDTNADTPTHLQQSLQEFRSDREAAAQRSGQPLPPSTKPPMTGPLQTKRWRYGGPWLAGMTELQFEAYLNHMDKEKIAAFEQHLKNGIRAQLQNRRAEELAKAAKVAADMGEEPAPTTDLPPIEVSDEDVTKQVRKLRQSPTLFGPEIAEFLDLPDGARDSGFGGITAMKTHGPVWEYKRSKTAPTIASGSYQTVGPPRTHPSAGFSYVRTNRLSKNSPLYGPQEPNYYLPARVLKDRTSREETGDGKQAHGVGGFVPRVAFSRHELREQWAPQKDGPKFVAQLKEMTVAQDGSIELETQRLPASSWGLKNNVPFSVQESNRQRSENAVGSMPTAPNRLEPLDSGLQQARSAPKRDVNTPNKETAEVLDELTKSFVRARR